MFYSCQNLNSIDFENFKTQNVEDLSFMFYNCNSLTSINLSNFNINIDANVNSMFNLCSVLKIIDISSFVFRSEAYMFSNLPNNCNVLINIKSVNKIFTIPDTCKIEINREYN